MPITRLVLGDFRNLQQVDLRPGAQVNFVAGANGSGKTSLLEAMSTLAVGRSFRTRKFKNVIAHERREMQLFCEFNQRGISQKLGAIRQRDGNSLFKLNEVPVTSATELAAVLPCQVINSHSFSLLEGGPGERRHFLDWLVFHVKPEFRQLWSEYSRGLKQRNSLLRFDRIPDPAELDIWNQTLAAVGERIDRLRKETLDALLPTARALIGNCGFIADGDFAMVYQPGWDTNHSLLKQLERQLERDLSLGHTSLGPHKADIKFTFNKKPAAEIFSRGQLKSLIAALYVAQMKTYQQFNQLDCLLLIDDLPAELDENNQRRFCGWLAELSNVQIFITGIDLTTTLSFWPAAPDSQISKLFHVKQGQIHEQPYQWSNP